MAAMPTASVRQRDVRRIAAAGLAPGSVVADWDACWIDGRRVADWRPIIEAGRLGDVNGAFAVAWADRDGVLSLARDPIGERTIYYTPDGFASTLPLLLKTVPVARRLDLVSLAAYLSWAYVPGERTMIEGVREVLPGEVVRFEPGGVVRRRLWSVPEEPAGEPDEEALRARLRASLEAAVRRRLDPGRPVAATLSGGIDSSLVVALARRLHDGPLLTYSVSFGDGYRNELPWSSKVAAHCGTEHRIVELSPDRVLRRLDDTIALLSDPIGDPLTVPNAVLFEEASERAGAVLNGEGGDPCFGGPKNLPMVLSELYGGTLRGDFGRESSYLRAHQKCYDDLGAMLSPEARAALAARPLETFLSPWFDDPRWRSMVARLMWMNLTFKGAHHILHKIDEVSAPAGVVPRSPLFDREVVERAFEIPPQLKLRGSVEKYLLKRAVEDLLPREILDRPKSGMLVPVEGWFSGPLLSAARERLLDGLPPYGLFARPWLERLLDRRLGGLRPRHGAKIWLLVTLESWLRGVLNC